MQNQNLLIHYLTTKEEFKDLLKSCIEETVYSIISSPDFKLHKEVKREEDDRLLTVKDLAKYCQVTETTIWNWIRKGIFPLLRINSRVRIRKSEFLKFERRRKKGEGDTFLWNKDFVHIRIQLTPSFYTFDPLCG